MVRYRSELQPFRSCRPRALTRRDRELIQPKIGKDRGTRRSSAGLPEEGVVCIFAMDVVYCGTDASNGRDARAVFETKLNMQTTIEETPVMQKTRELCQTILEQSTMQSIRQRIDAFMADEETRAQYDTLVSKGEALQQKQQMSIALGADEIAEFEKYREGLMKNPVASGFLDAQEELHQVQQSVQQYVNKTLELGRLPTEDEMGGGSCGHGCGCGHSH